MASKTSRVSKAGARGERKTPIERRLLGALVPLVGAIVFALYQRQLGWRWGELPEQNAPTRQPGQPARLLAYEQFSALFARDPSKLLDGAEQSDRKLLFAADLISVARNNLSFMLGKQTYLVRQSPFSLDRTAIEQRTCSGQPDALNVTSTLDRMDCMSQSESFRRFDSPVSGLSRDGKLEKNDNMFTRWLRRQVNSDGYFEIPNFPLDQQPDPERVTHIDADLRKCSDTIRDQLECGACYAFSWTSFVEWHYCSQTGKRINFSEQHIVDCGGEAKMKGCQEGRILEVRAFTQTKGLCYEANYPYKGKQGACKRTTGELEVMPKGWKRIIVDREEWEEVLKEQPILVEVRLPEDIMSYVRGIHSGRNCEEKRAHGMILVGHGRQNGVPYWLLKNSMGLKWGEMGYLRLSREAPMEECFATGFISRFKFANVDEDAYEEFYENLNFVPTLQPEQTETKRKETATASITRWLENRR